MDLSRALEPPPETWAVRSPYWHAYPLSGMTGTRERRYHTPSEVLTDPHHAAVWVTETIRTHSTREVCFRWNTPGITR
ncbi:hypothetical protein J2S53_004397 [Actinopolyspora lacussalsi]|nr:hypothetical protein [Actinopolyspora lacussalsi]